MASKRGRKKARNKQQQAAQGRSQPSTPPPQKPPSLPQLPANDEPPRRRSRWNAFSLWSHPFRSIFGVVGILATAVTLLLAYPWIDLQKGESLDVDNPYKTMLTAENTGAFPISNVIVDCLLNSSGDDFHLSNDTTTMAVRGTYWHNQKFTLPCIDSLGDHHSRGGMMLMPYGTKFNSAELKVTIHYSILRKVRRSETFLLMGMTADDGSIHWSFEEP